MVHGVKSTECSSMIMDCAPEVRCRSPECFLTHGKHFNICYIMWLIKRCANRLLRGLNLVPAHVIWCHAFCIRREGSCFLSYNHFIIIIINFIFYFLFVLSPSSFLLLKWKTVACLSALCVKLVHSLHHFVALLWTFPFLHHHFWRRKLPRVFQAWAQPVLLQCTILSSHLCSHLYNFQAIQVK